MVLRCLSQSHSQGHDALNPLFIPKQDYNQVR
jgi:hypothetical protein